jgi:hypothetical protein
MENLKIEIRITDGEKSAKTSVSVNDYKMIKHLHGTSMLDLQVDALIDEVEKSLNKTDDENKDPR